MLQAMNTGHEGSLTTIHANSPRDALSRLETLVLTAGVDLPLRAIREQISSAFDLLVQISRLVDGSRRITHVTEVLRMESDVVTLQDIFVAEPPDEGRRPRARVLGPLECTGLKPHFLEKMAANGVVLPPRSSSRRTTRRRRELHRARASGGIRVRRARRLVAVRRAARRRRRPRAGGGVDVRRCDTSGFPHVHLTVVTGSPARVAAPARERQAGRRPSASTISGAKRSSLAIDRSRSMKGAVARGRLRRGAGVHRVEAARRPGRGRRLRLPARPAHRLLVRADDADAALATARDRPAAGNGALRRGRRWPRRRSRASRPRAA